MKSEVNQTGLQVENYVLEVKIETKESLMRFHNNQKSPFFRITLALPKHVPTARRTLNSVYLRKNYTMLINAIFQRIQAFLSRVFTLKEWAQKCIRLMRVTFFSPLDL